ncbi:MAG TPA: TIGR01459 family HAD-type hydrolase [Caulobacteraceae bacterium]|nr:TIGR01459 family HAD-type hydrolase [Caulobacteraceae bacterium]
MTRTIAGLSEIADRYDALICDVWGVVHNGREAYQPACEAMANFAGARGPVVLLSNAPRPASAVVPQLDGFSVPRAAWQGFITSGDATRALLTQRAPGPAWRIGPDRDQPLFEGIDLQFAGPETAAFIACTGLVDDDLETPEDYRQSLSIAAGRELEMICANPDRVVQRGDKLVYCAGALADLYEGLGGKVTMAGKPYAPVYEEALAEVSRLAGRTVDRARVLCVGDGLPTDILGANNQGLDALFVLGGIHGAELAGDAQALLDREGLKAAWSMSELVW